MANLRCFKCLKVFSFLNQLWKHMKNTHQITTKSKTKLVCAQEGCSLVYYTGYGYKRHLQIHLNDRPVADHPRQHLPNVDFQNDNTEPNGGSDCDDLDIAEDNESDEMEAPRSKAEIIEEVKESTSVFISHLKSSSVPSSTIHSFVKETAELVETIVSGIREIASPILDDITAQSIPAIEKVDDFCSTLQHLNNPFESFNLFTSYQQTQYVQEAQVLIKPQEMILGQVYKETLNRRTGRTEQKEISETFQYIPIRENLKVLLEQPGYMSAVIQAKQDQTQGSILHSYRDGSYYKENINLDAGKITIDLLIYNDEFETANPLGPNKGKHKLLGVYLSLLCLPSRYQAKLDNILLVALAKSTLVAKYGMNSILANITEDLQDLYRTGIEISCPEFTGLVYPKLLQAIGDNLALNTILGYAGSFSANYFCRFCKSMKPDTMSQTEEDESSLRTKASNDRDLQTNDVSQTGIHRSCELNQLDYYHVSDNVAPDIMHDFLEGLLPIEMKLVLGELINSGYFDLDELNSRIVSYSYGYTDGSNKPCPISRGQLNNPFGASGQTASQMHCLALNIPLIIGDKIPLDDQFWELFISLLDIYKIVVAPSITVEATYYLQAKIKHHHEMYLELFPERHLIPKHHHLLHYPRAIRKLGPLIYFSCMRQEAKHKPLKRWAKSCNNYKNIAKTLAIKHQENQAFRILKQEHIDSKSLEILGQDVAKVSDLVNEEDLCNILGCTPDSKVVVCGVVIINGYKFRSNIMVLVDWTEEVPKFGQVKLIITYQSQVQLLVQPWRTLDLDDHYRSFAVEENFTASLEIIQPERLMDYRPLHVVKSYSVTDQTWYISTRFMLL